MPWRSTLLSSAIASNWVRSSSACRTVGCGRTSAPSRHSTMPSPPSPRPPDDRGKRLSAFAREGSYWRSTLCPLFIHFGGRLRRSKSETRLEIDGDACENVAAERIVQLRKGIAGAAADRTKTGGVKARNDRRSAVEHISHADA